MFGTVLSYLFVSWCISSISKSENQPYFMVGKSLACCLKTSTFLPDLYHSSPISSLWRVIIIIIIIINHIIIIIIIQISSLLSVSYNPSPGLYSRLSVREGSDYMPSIYLLIYSAAFFGCYICSHIDSILQRRWAVPQNAILLIFHIGWDCLVYYHYYIIPCVFFIPALSEGLSL